METADINFSLATSVLTTAYNDGVVEHHRIGAAVVDNQSGGGGSAGDSIDLMLIGKSTSSSSYAMSLGPLTLASYAGIIFVTCLYIIHLIALLYSRYRLHHRVKPNGDLPGVSVIKPLVGYDDNLRSNVQSFFTQPYHKFELLFCVHSREDPAVDVVRELMRRYPKVDARIFFGGENVGLNPKINNMMPAYKSAKYPLILISDSAITMLPDSMLDMVTSMESDPKMALVTQMPYCKDRPGFAAAVEQVYFGTSHGRIYLAGNCMSFVCSTGMSSMMRKSCLDECGGIAAFGSYLAEDYFFGRHLADRGYRSAISTNPALQNGARTSLDSFFDRICRWIKLRIAMLPHIILVEPLQDCFPSGIIISLALKCVLGFNPTTVFALHVVFWFSMDYMLMNSIQNGDLPFSTWTFAAAWAFREASAPFIFAMAICQPNIKWRHNTFRLDWGGRIVEKVLN